MSLSENVRSGMIITGISALLVGAVAATHLTARHFMEQVNEQRRAEIHSTLPPGCVVQDNYQQYDCAPDGLMWCDRYMPKIICGPDADKQAAREYAKKMYVNIVIGGE